MSATGVPPLAKHQQLQISSCSEFTSEPRSLCPRSPIKPVSLGSGGQPHHFHYLINHTRLALSSGGRSQMAPTLSSLLALLFLLGSPVVAHKHHSALNEAANAPVDSILWIHIVVQTIVWGFLFPIGMVLGLSRSRWHVPLQVCTSPLNGRGSHLIKCTLE